MPSKFLHQLFKLHHEKERDALRIVGDAAIARPDVGEGRLIPLVILDTANRPDLEEYIRIHEQVRSGDVNCQWGQLEGHKNTIALILSFVRPAELVAIIEFDLDRNHGVLVEQALAAKALYIQSGREGDRLKYTIDAPKVIAEVPDLGFLPHWDKIHFHHMMEKMRAHGLSRSEARRKARLVVDEIRKLASTARVPSM